MIIRRAPTRQCRDSRVQDLNTTVTHEHEYPRPLPPNPTTRLVLQVRCCVCAIREELGGEFEDAEGGVLRGKASRWSPCLNVPQFSHGVSRIAESPPSAEAAVMDGGMSPGGGRREFTPPGPEGNDGKDRGRRQGGGGRRQRLRNMEQVMVKILFFVAC